MKFQLADREHEAALRTLARDASMPGWIRLAFGREPDFFQAIAVQGKSNQVLVAVEDGRVVGQGCRSIKPAWINGQRAEIGYLGGLRLIPDVRRTGALARGYAALRQLHEENPVPVYLTTIVEYLGRGQRFLSRALFAVPPEIAQVADPDAFECLTLRFLLRERNLRLISVWHPSFLCLLMRALPSRLQAIARAIDVGGVGECNGLPPALPAAFERRLLPDPVRAQDLRNLDTAQPDFPTRIWPHLRVISCWADGWSEPWLAELGRQFPRAAIQAKGLTATEGIVSFPIGRDGRKVCAVRSHFFEFVDAQSGDIRRAWEIAPGRDYRVVLTTQGGLYRYRLHDLVRVTGFLRRAPCLEFVARDNLVSDLVGEKLNVRHVEESIRRTEADCGTRFTFAMLAPVLSQQAAGYVLFAQAAAGATVNWPQVRTRLEAELNRNVTAQVAAPKRAAT